MNEKVLKYLASKGFADRVTIHEETIDTPDELERASDAAGWCDVCKGWEDE